MAEKWDKQLMEFLKRTGDELKRTGDDLKTEAQRLMVEVQDPSKQAKVKEGLENLRSWAVTTGKQAAERIESAVRRVETTVGEAFERQGSGAPSAPGTPPVPGTPGDKVSAATPPRPTPAEEPVDAAQPGTSKKKAPKAGASKSIGRNPQKKAAARPVAKSASKTKAGSKSIGRKKPARPAS